jgi:hypothetical protein
MFNIMHFSQTKAPRDVSASRKTEICLAAHNYSLALFFGTLPILAEIASKNLKDGMTILWNPTNYDSAILIPTIQHSN